MPLHPKIADSPNPLVTPAPQAPRSVVPNRGELPTAHVAHSSLLFSNWTAGEWIEYSALVALVAVLTVVVVTKLAWMLHSWRSTSHLGNSGFSRDPRPPRRTFTLLVPARHEGMGLTATLDQLARQDHPHVEIIAIVGDDDPATELVAREAAERHPGLIRIIIDDGVSKSRPAALNRALEVAQGEVIGVFKAGDEVDPRLLRFVDSRFSETDADVVQGGVQQMNLRASWWSLRSVLESYFWFRSGLHLLARSRSVPLGDSTAFIKRSWLEWSDGWDENCLAEDYELGVRLSSGGAKVVISYTPGLVTRQRNPKGVSYLYGLRTRRDLGSLQSLGKEEWRRLPSLRQRLFARYVLIAPFVQSATAVLIPLSILFAFFFRMPVLIILVSFLPLAVVVVTLAVEIAGLSEFGRLYDLRVRVWDYARLILGALPYQVVLTAASLNALVTATEKDYSLRKSTGSADEQNSVAAADRPRIEPVAPERVVTERAKSDHAQTEHVRTTR